jgi:hypothetical protein
MFEWQLEIASNFIQALSGKYQKDNVLSFFTQTVAKKCGNT